eukprot:TRINITY_DN2953_c2_g1_i1.p1 TRINITY_DN2953_c2_g1~~TRINITY_DN2953_c2_g1_i1.p1  ORF type:complete len:165 (-),score=35.02 TRINITY_DN2953_c2_g1_i1:33-527(-)
MGDFQAPYDILLISYLIVGDLNNARFLWKRIPSQTKQQNPQLGALWSIGQALWNENYPLFYASVSAYEWNVMIGTMVSILIEQFRQKTFKLLSRGFSMISTNTISTHLGLSPEDTLQLIAERGWEEHPEIEGMFKPKPIEEILREGSSLADLQSLTNYVVFLHK